MVDTSIPPDESHAPKIWPAPREPKTPLMSRRSFIRRTVQLAVAGAVIPGAMSQLLPAVAPDALGGGGTGAVIRRDPATNAKVPITLGDLDGDPPVVVTAEWNFLPAVIYKVKASILEASSMARGYNTAQFAIQHPTEPEHAIMVYEGKCKHLGCTVGFDKSLGGSKDIPDYDEDGARDGRILCPCHQGQYDIYNLATNVPGTPPPQPLNVVRFNIATSYPGDPATRVPAGSNVILGVEKLVQTKEAEASKAGASSTYRLRPAATTVEPEEYSWESGA